MAKLLIYDTEIKHMILGRNEQLQPGIRYCNGWTDYTGMGISVLCAYEFDTANQNEGTMHTLQPEDDKAHADHLQGLISRAEYIVGFNNHSFDDKLLAANGVKIPESKSYDIYMQVLYATGWQQGSYRPGGYKLDLIARANGIPGKGEVSGALAPIMWQQGKIQEVYDYCAADVLMTLGVLRTILAKNLICPNRQVVLPVKTPSEVLGSVQVGLF